MGNAYAYWQITDSFWRARVNPPKVTVQKWFVVQTKGDQEVFQRVIECLRRPQVSRQKLQSPTTD